MEVRERIVKEATSQFFKYGIKNVTMDDIAVSLGISKRTVYENFKDKSELVMTCIEILTKIQDKKVESVISNSKNTIEAIFVFTQEGIKALNAINPVFFKDFQKLYPSTFQKMEKEGFVKRAELSSHLLNKGIKEGLFRNDLNIEIISKLFHHQIDILADDAVFPRDKYNHAEVFQSMVINFTRGISTRKGIEVIENIVQ